MATIENMDDVDKKNSYGFYWRLNEDYGSTTNMRSKIRERGYVTEVKKLEKGDLVKLLQRQDRGLPCYDRCSDKELKRFTTARNLQCYLESNKSEQMSKLLRDLAIQTLTEADDNPSFNKFMDLPPELRIRIYEYYNREFPDALYFPTKPPLSRISRQVRQEMLPVFFSTHEFTLSLVRHRSDTTVFRPSDQTYIWLSQLSPADVAEISRLNIFVSDRRNRTANSSVGVVGRIEMWLDSWGGASRLWAFSGDDRNFETVWTRELKQRLRQELLACLNDLV